MKSETQKAWAKSVNDPSNWSYKDGIYGNKVDGKLTAMHYMVYNVVRGLPIDRGFTKDSEIFKNKLSRFDGIVDRVTEAEGMNYQYARQILAGYLEFFGETVDINEFMENAYESLRLYSNS